MSIKVALIGAGGRGMMSYAPYALKNPNEMVFTAVAEPKDYMREEFASQYSVSPENCFKSWEQLLDGPKKADALIIATQDTMHIEPAMLAMEKGYKYILLEKPISPVMQECIDLAKAAKEYGAHILVCHSLRYAPVFRAVKDLIESNAIGKLVSVELTEGVGFYHYAHSFVRGDWQNSNESSPMILAKSCHDMDLLLYITGKNCVNLSSFGSLKQFKSENAPEGSTDRCLDGCKARYECQYYAPKIYNDTAPVFAKLACEKEGYTDINEALSKGRYGQCVYKCNNNVVDHQTVNFEFEDGVTGVFTMSAFTHRTERDMRLMGTNGEIFANFEDDEIEIHNFITGLVIKQKVWRPNSGHGGADEIIMRDFVNLVQSNGNEKGLSDISISVQSHVMAFASEISRLEGRTVKLNEFKNS
jgi:predicted dehydrogenase